MILPEHKEAIVQYNKELSRKQQAVLDEQEREAISWTLATSFQEGVPLRLTLFGAFDDDDIVGTVTQLDVLRQRVRLRLLREDRFSEIEEQYSEQEEVGGNEPGEQWIALKDIVKAE